MIDWTKPIETVPCVRNPKPVPCRVVSGPDAYGDYYDAYGDYYVEVAGEWLDSNGAVRRGEWCCVPSGDFLVLDGSVRNVATAEAVTAPTCPMCDDTGSKDYAGFAMDPCDHEDAELARLKAEKHKLTMRGLFQQVDATMRETELEAERDAALSRAEQAEAELAAERTAHRPIVTDPPKTLRDEFAMAALAALRRDGQVDVTARFAYQLADAMMAERRKGDV